MVSTGLTQESKVVRKVRFEVGFWSVGLAFLAVMALGTAPSPLYGLYQLRDGFSTFTITLIFAVYSLGSTSSLFLAGHLSDLWGRKYILLMGLIIAAASAASFLWWRSLTGLYVGRFLTGLSVGVVAATATAYMTELHVQSKPKASLRRAQLAGTTVNLGGLALGALLSGVLAQYVYAPLTVIYVVVMSALGVGIIAVALAPETWSRPIPRPHYHPQRIAVPRAARGQFFAATSAAALSFAGLGLFTGLAGVLLVQTLHRTSLALSGATVFAVFAGAVLAQFLTLTWSRTSVLVTGIATYLLGLGLVVTSIWLPSANLTLFIVGGAITGVGAGAIFKGSLGTVMMIAESARRAESLAGILLAGYVGLSVPAIGLGVALRDVSPKATLLGFALVVAFAIIAATPTLLRGERTLTNRRVPQDEALRNEAAFDSSTSQTSNEVVDSSHVRNGGRVTATK